MVANDHSTWMPTQTPLFMRKSHNFCCWQAHDSTVSFFYVLYHFPFFALIFSFLSHLSSIFFCSRSVLILFALSSCSWISRLFLFFSFFLFFLVLQSSPSGSASTPAWSFQQRHPADVAALPSSFSFHYSSLLAQHEAINPQVGLLSDCVQLLLQFFPLFLSILPVFLGLESILRRNLKQNNIGLVWLRAEKETFITRREQILRCKIMRQADLALLYVIATVLTFRHTAAAAAALPYHSERIWNMVYTQKIKDQF